MTTNNDRKEKKDEEAGLHIHYGGMTLGSLLRQLRADKSLDGVGEEILAKIIKDKEARDANASKEEE
jgi:hypothetical protein